MCDAKWRSRHSKPDLKYIAGDKGFRAGRCTLPAGAGDVVGHESATAAPPLEAVPANANVDTNEVGYVVRFAGD
jgi:hypothetical protein